MTIPIALISLVGSSLHLPIGVPAAEASLPVRWIPNRDFPITSLAQCEEWRRSRPVSLGGDHRLELSFGDGRPKIPCSTVEDWIRGRDAGAYAYSTFDITMECHFRNAARWYVSLPRLQASARTSFPSVPTGLGDLRIELLRNIRFPTSPGRKPPHRFELDADGWGFRIEDGDRWEWFSPVGLGDWDGDGWEDLIGMHGDGFMEGSGRFHSPILFARRTSGRLVDISRRLLPESATPAEIAAARARWLDSCGLPEGGKSR